MALLILRVGIGALFIYAGWEKIISLDATLAGFSKMGFNAFWTYCAIAAEFLGGIAMVIGFGTRVASIFTAITMIVAAYVVRHDPHTLTSALSLFFVSLAFLASGSGKYAIKQSR
ncbi:MAG: DoxX family protein [Candidatus Magasanikbacteria bacterium]|nr:DoxX family protein [Candidatus Magasanikbacteria bacterium]